MKRILTFLACCVLVFATASTSVMATSTLEDVVGENTVVGNNDSQTGNESQTGDSNDTGSTSGYVTGEQFSSSLKDATNLNEPNQAATKVNGAVKKFVSIVAQILSYGITALLALRVLLDLMYIAIPFTRGFLGNGFMGAAQNQGGMQGGMGMGGMGGMGSPMGGMGMGGMGMGRYGGMGRMGMGGMGGMHGGMGMNGMQGAMQGQQAGMMGKTQWVSYAALNAVASAQMPGPDGKSMNPFKIYVKDMVITLVLTAALVVLAMSGALTQFGILLGEMIASGVAGLGNMF